MQVQVCTPEHCVPCRLYNITDRLMPSCTFKLGHETWFISFVGHIDISRQSVCKCYYNVCYVVCIMQIYIDIYVHVNNIHYILNSLCASCLNCNIFRRMRHVLYIYMRFARILIYKLSPVQV